MHIVAKVCAVNFSTQVGVKMKVIELFRQKGSPIRKSDIYAKDDALPKKDIHDTMAELDGKGATPHEILKAVKMQYGPAAMHFARTHLPHIISEAVQIIPQTKDQLKLLQDIFDKPLPTEYATAILRGILSDDGLNDDLRMAKPGTDARPIVAKWIELNMPYLVKHTGKILSDGDGSYSPLHGGDYSNADISDQCS